MEDKIGVFETTSAKTHKRLDALYNNDKEIEFGCVYYYKFNPMKWVYANSLAIEEGKIIIENHRGEKHKMNINDFRKNYFRTNY